MTCIETQRLSLRPLDARDLDPLAAMHQDTDVMAHMPRRLSRGDTRSFIERAMAHHRRQGFGFWVAHRSDSGAFVGLVGLFRVGFEAPFTPAVEIGWRLARAEWGNGFATEGARAALAFGFDTLRLEQIVAFTVAANVRSRAVMQRLGMIREPADDFDHPRIEAGHRLRRHMLYRMPATRWSAQLGALSINGHRAR